MKKLSRILTILASVLMAAVILISALITTVPAATMDEIDREDAELAESGAVYRDVSFDSLPEIEGFSLNKSVRTLMPDVDKLSLNINGKHRLTILDGYSRSVNSRIQFTSSASSVYVTDTGLITGVREGSAIVFAYDPVTHENVSCQVTVSNKVIPTEPETIPPTEEPPEAPTVIPTQAPTQKPTENATEKPTQPPTVPPTQAPTQKPTTAPVINETLSINASSATVYKGSYYHVVATSNTSVSFSSSNTSVATVDSRGIVTALSNGTATITARTTSKSAACQITVKTGGSVNLSHKTASVYRFKSLLIKSSTSGVKWSSSDPSVAAVDLIGTTDKAFIRGVKAGTAVITASTSTGTATCIITVNPSCPVRFAYSSPNCASKNQKVTLVCITDTMRTAVRFAVETNSGTQYVDATSKTADADTFIWKGTTSFSQAGTYNIKAYSQFNNGTSWHTCEDGETTAFVTDTTDKMTTICARRRASDEVIQLISTFEGFSDQAYDDYFTGDPTVGYGRVVFTGEQFYNKLTKAEAFAYLIHSVNNEGYASNVNNFLLDKRIKFNQQQFDALVCFVYNTGAGPLYSDDELIAALMDCSDGTGSIGTYYYINGTGVRIRKGPGTNYDIIKELDYNTELMILSTSNTDWYQVQLNDGTKGYVSSEYISSRSVGGNLDFNYIHKQGFIDKLCMYHHAGGCVWGLLYRRVDETEMFFYGDYEPCYGTYKYPIKFTCTKNPSYHT